MIRKIAPVIFAALLAPSLAQAQGTVQWGASDKEKPYRQPAEGIKGYYEPEAVNRNGAVVSFKIYRSGDPSVATEVGSYMVNCETREYSSVVDGNPTPPEKLLAGEQLYPMSAKLCEWNKKGFF